MDKITYDTYFLGVLPCDYLPKTPLKIYPLWLFLIRIHPEPGQHWAVYINKDGVSCFFDSFGRGPKNPSFPKIVQDFLKNNSIRVQYSNKQIQDFTSMFVVSIVYFFCITCQKDTFMKILLKCIMTTD